MERLGVDLCLELALPIKISLLFLFFWRLNVQNEANPEFDSRNGSLFLAYEFKISRWRSGSQLKANSAKVMDEALLLVTYRIIHVCNFKNGVPAVRKCGKISWCLNETFGINARLFWNKQNFLWGMNYLQTELKLTICGQIMNEWPNRLTDMKKFNMYWTEQIFKSALCLWIWK